MDANLLQAQHFGPQTCQNLFLFRLRKINSPNRMLSGVRHLGPGQPLAIHLARWRHGQRIQPHDHTRQHILRQPLLQIPAQIHQIKQHLIHHHIRRQMNFLMVVRISSHCAVADAGKSLQHVLNLAGFNPEAVKFAC